MDDSPASSTPEGGAGTLAQQLFPESDSDSDQDRPMNLNAKLLKQLEGKDKEESMAILAQNIKKIKMICTHCLYYVPVGSVLCPGCSLGPEYFSHPF